MDGKINYIYHKISFQLRSFIGVIPAFPSPLGVLVDAAHMGRIKSWTMANLKRFKLRYAYRQVSLICMMPIWSWSIRAPLLGDK